MLNKALEAFGGLGDDEELGPADWPTVQRHITCLNDLDGQRTHPHNVSESENHLQNMNLKDIRIRLLNGKLSGDSEWKSAISFRLGYTCRVQDFFCTVEVIYVSYKPNILSRPNSTQKLKLIG